MCRIWWFGYRVESSGCRTAKLANIVSLQFGYRDESPGRQTFHHGPDLHIPFGYRVVSPGSQSKNRPAGLFFPFGYRVDSPGSQPIADEPAGQVPNRALEADEKRRYSCFIDPGRVVFPSDADLRRRRFPLQQGYSSLFAYWSYDTAAVLFRQRARSSRPGRRLPISVSC